MSNAESIGATPMPDPRINTVFVEANGLTFEVDQCGSGDKLALCLHGFPEHSFSWRYQLPMLADLGYEAWAPNLRGYGKSSRPGYVEDYAMASLLADIGCLIDAAGKAEVVLIAHDWGALIAWEFAIQKIRPLQKLIICNVPHPAAAREAFSFAQLRKSWYILFFQIPRLPEKLLGRRGAKPIADVFLTSSLDPQRFPPDVLSLYQENAAQPGALTAMINYYRALLRYPLKVKRDKNTPMIATPTLLVWGEGDTALGKELTYATGKYVENLQIRYLADVSHWVQQEAPEVTNAMIDAFLTDSPVPFAKWQMNLVSEEDAGIA
ncbi:MAG: pimeloyl-ACP methyl ester carboxylesterase [Candidatus Pseudothioglobus sp.]|jgi:pimeloyl-ACP methyl ester carboxylesterase